MRKLTLKITPDMEGREVKALLKSELGLSSSLIKRIKQMDEGVMLNGCRVFVNARVSAGDVLSAAVGEENPPIAHGMAVYADDDIVIIDKPAGMEVHPGPLSGGSPTVMDIIAQGRSFHPVNRLDRGTTGLMAIAANGYIHDCLRKQLHTETFVREYLAVTEGIPYPMSGIIELPIGRQGAVKRMICENGAPAVTQYATEAVNSGRALVRMRLKTGRTHQIRVHMAAIGCPLAGDWLYGREDRELITRPALHSARIALVHPVTGAGIDISSPLPRDMDMLMR